MVFISPPSLRVRGAVAAAVLIAAPTAGDAQTSNGPPRFVCSGTERYEGPNCPGATASGKAPPGAPTVPPPNPAERAAEIERARQKVKAQARAQANARTREEAEAEERRRIEAERQAQFAREKDAGVSGLKGIPREAGLRDAVRDTPSFQSGERPNFVRPSQRTALRQATCAMTVLTEALRNTEGPEALAQSIGQASFILDGGAAPSGTKCPEPEWDIPPGVNVQAVMDRTRAIATRARELLQAPEPAKPGRALTPDEQRIQAVFAQQMKNEQRYRDKDAPVVAVQEKINRVQERKYDLKDPKVIKREQDTRVELNKYVKPAERLEEGKVEEFIAEVDAILGGSAPKNP